MENGLIYDMEIQKDLTKLSEEHSFVLSHVKKDSSVLEIGCHTGYFSYWLKEKGCSVFGVDIYEPAVKKASKYLDDYYVGDVESDAFIETLENKTFDTIIIMHVLEHLINPQVLLLKLQNHLTEEGNIVISIPNISCWNSRLNIFKGNFNYTDTGIMDKTHLRFFNYITAKELIHNTGYQNVAFKGVGKSTFSTVPSWRFIWRLNQISSKVFQFIFRNNPNILFHVLVFNIKKQKSK